jgi:membrane protein required for colicin V production
MIGWVDIILVVILAGAMIAGLIKGLVKEVIGLAAVIIGFIVASRSYNDVAGFLLKGIHEPAIAKFLGFLIVFLGVLILGWLAAWLLSKLMIGPLKFINHILGGAFGLLEGILICGVLVFALLVFPINNKALADSKLAPYCYGLTKALVHLVPQELKSQFKEAYRKFIEELKSIKEGTKNGQEN